MKKLNLIPFLLLALPFCAFAQKRIAAKNAVKHIGENVTICDKVFDGKLSANAVVLAVAGDEPNQLLTVIIPAADRKKFKGHPETDYKGKDIMITGKLLLYKNKPGIVVSDPRQLKPVLADNVIMRQSAAVKTN